ncbi:hypothetical protein BT63DRAFT_216981 [Microthyrium microscopicum]|uniref:Uncharacterized protein n=1 Tax=Microthyrium microscopicum TaxID=703497 RepID=A0A6A6UIQ8_9PEZI|nr:hypothetical protein BT63DRAFT_216981 [Microthyrium microscopicum]
MRYIRLIQPPHVVLQDGRPRIKCKVTVTNDLGDSFCPVDLDLVLFIRRVNDAEIFFDQRIVESWKGTRGMRVLTFEFEPSREMINAPQGVSIVVAAILPRHKSVAADTHAFPKDSKNLLPGSSGLGLDKDMVYVMGVQSAQLLIKTGCRASNELSRRDFWLADDTIMHIWESSGSHNIESHIWDAGLATIAFLNNEIAKKRRKRLHRRKESRSEHEQHNVSILELGCGVGLVGTFLARMFPNFKVTTTDRPEASPLATTNISSNSTTTNISFHPLPWGTPLPPTLSQPYNLILATDCTYNPDTFPLLLNSLSQLAETSPNVLVFIASKTRHVGEAVFDGMMGDGGWVVRKRWIRYMPWEFGNGGRIAGECEEEDEGGREKCVFTYWVRGVEGAEGRMELGELGDILGV